MAGNYFSSDTIAAVATSLAGDGGVGIIRLSGPRALEVSNLVCRGLDKAQPRFLQRVEVFQASTGAVLDDGLGVYFPSGQSFTGEEVIELQLHGGRFILQSVLQLLIATGNCRLALPGEFSFRAVRNGKQTLSGAEAVGQLISARSMFEVQAARRNLGRARCEEFEKIAAKLRNLLAQCELSIDFVDQDVEVISLENMTKEVLELLTKVDGLVLQMQAAQRIARGLQVTLVGSPNAGKSTLFNALLSEDRAIVSPEAGTTRDVITEELQLGPYFIRLADTAGMRVGRGSIEKEGISRAKDLAAESDAVVLVIDGTQDVDAIRAQVKQSDAESGVMVVVLNKWDLVSAKAQADRMSAVSLELSGGVVIPLSASTGAGIEALFAAIRATLDARFGLGANSFLPTEFQLQMLLESREAMKQVLELLGSTGLSHPELLSSGLNSAVRALSDLVGETTPDTVLAKIFSEFCIGK